MSEKANYFKVGLFVIVALGLILATIMILGAGSFFRKNLIMETYINESVQGLEIGSPVKLRGVKIGEVKTIAFVDDVYETDYRYVMVRFSILPRVLKTVNMETVARELRRDIDKGLRLRLTSQGITGTAYLEADYSDPTLNPPLPIDWAPESLYIPSSPSLITRISDTAGMVLRRMGNMQFEQTLSNVNHLMESATCILTHDVAPTLQSIRSSLDELRPVAIQLSAAAQVTLKQELPTLIHDTRSLAQVMSNTAANANRSILRAERMLDSEADHLDETLVQLRDASGDIRDFIRDVRRYPSRMLFGAPPASVSPEP